MSTWQRWKGIMKAYPFEEKRLSKWAPPFIVQPKYDGIRCRAVPTPSGYVLVSSEENVISSVPHINKFLNESKVLSKSNIEFDGELYIHGKSFEEITSITQRTVNLHTNYKSMSFYIFDIVNEDEQLRRLLELNNLSDEIYGPLWISPYWLCNNLNEVMEQYSKLISDGYEGIIVRNLMAHYEKKRSTYVMKFKPKKSDTYRILSYVEEISIEGNPKGTLGALICASGDGNTFNVGTGFTESQRKLLWLNKETLPGKKALVEYQHITSGKGVPRFPVFVKVI